MSSVHAVVGVWGKVAERSLFRLARIAILCSLTPLLVQPLQES
jgi:hypothetical protein